MWHLRNLVLFLLFSLGCARRSNHIADSRHRGQQQNNTLANSLEMSAEARDAFFPGGVRTGVSRRPGMQAGTLREGVKQVGQRHGPFESHRAAPWPFFGPYRAEVSLQADGGPEADKSPSKIPSVLPTYNRAPLSFVKGEGAWLTEADGRRFLDMSAGIAVNALGHAHPALVAALTQQAQKLWHVSNLFQIPEQQLLADKLIEHTFADTAFFTNSGTESCELAVKMARKYFYDREQPERVEIITFTGSFHGRSCAGIAAAGSEKLTKGFGPLLPGFVHVKFGDMKGVTNAITGRTAAIMIEPVQGEGGIRPVPDAELKALRQICDENGLLLIFDEVQCGVGRTGKLFAHEWAGVAPDIMMIAKGIGGGFPLGAVLANEEAASGMTAGTHGSTYGGNPLGCAVGLAVMDHVTTPAFLEDVNRKAGLLRQKAEGLVADHPEVFEEVRGIGLMLGIKCKLTNSDVVNAGYDNEIITVVAGDNAIRLLPPLTLTEEDIGEAIIRLDKAATQLEADLTTA